MIQTNTPCYSEDNPQGKGYVCSLHFKDTDMNTSTVCWSTKRKLNSLKKSALPRPSIDKARDSSFSLISLAADSLLYNAVSTIRYLFFVTLHEKKALHVVAMLSTCKVTVTKKEVLWILHCKATSRLQVK